MNNLTNVYHQDFCLWISRNVELLRKGRLSEIDIHNIAEELEDMGKNQQRELVNRLRMLFAHLLKWQFQPDRRSDSWKGTIIEQRNQIKQLLKISPSLKHQLDEKLADAYSDAIEYAALETGIPESDLLKICPYSSEQVLDKTFYPDCQ